MRSLTAKDIMNPEVITVRDQMSVREVAQFLIDNNISGAPVVDETGELVGVVSLWDIVETASEAPPAAQQGRSDFYLRSWDDQIWRDQLMRLQIENESLPVHLIMTPTIFTVPEYTSVSDIAKTMIAGRIHRLLVTKGGSVVGIITTLDMLKVIVNDNEQLPPATPFSRNGA